MDAVLILFLIVSLVGTVIQVKYKDEPILYLTLIFASGGLFITVGSDLAITEMTIILLGEFVAWIYSFVNLLRRWEVKI